MDELVLVRLAMSMSTRVLAPNEVAPLRCMYVLTKGCGVRQRPRQRPNKLVSP